MPAAAGVPALTTEQSKTVQEVAKASGKALDVLKSVGSYAADVLGTLPHDAVGLLGADKLHHRRIRNTAKLEEETRQHLEKIDANRLSTPSPSVVIPLLMAAADEERPSLRDLWARLLANAAIDGGRKVRREFFDTAAKLEPLDAAVMEILEELTSTNFRTADQQIVQIVDTLTNRQIGGVIPFNVEISLEALARLDCTLKPVPQRPAWMITQYGRAFLIACRVA